MLLILLSWLYTLSITLIAGISINRLLKLQDVNPVLVIFHGFFIMTLFTGFWAIALPVSGLFHIVVLLLSIILGYKSNTQITAYLIKIKLEISQLNRLLKLLFLGVSLIILAQCATAPLLLDNESYYIQTIKWLNEFGFVKGLINLHLFLGQTSGWHILQSAFNISDLYPNFNDLSGLCLLLGNYYAFIKLNAYLSKKDSSKTTLAFGLFPLCNIGLLPFISSPSPDIAVYVLAMCIFCGFIRNYHACSKNGILSLVMLTAFLILIKVTTVVFIMFPLIIYIKHYKNVKQFTAVISGITLITIGCIGVKNWIITGNILYPFSGIDSLKTAWSLPTSIQNYFYTYVKAYGYGVSPEVYTNSSFIDLLKTWILQSGMDGLMNKILLVVLVAVPFFIKPFTKYKPLAIIYGAAIVHSGLLWITSPQFRFYLPFLIVLTLIIASRIITKKKVINSLVSVSVLGCVLLFFIPQTHRPSFSFQHVLTPHANSQYATTSKPLKLGNTTFNTPTGIPFFWGTGNTPLPAINKQQLEYFKTYFNVIPQQRGEALKDGFYFKILE